ncbi:copper resistance protein [Escherichia coli]|nr:copper resistance protein [Escherichia coli]PQP29785.1 copper resistance protein [Escherichia coli]
MSCPRSGAQFKNDGHYFCRAGGNRPDGLNEPVTIQLHKAF